MRISTGELRRAARSCAQLTARLPAANGRALSGAATAMGGRGQQLTVHAGRFSSSACGTHSSSASAAVLRLVASRSSSHRTGYSRVGVLLALGAAGGCSAVYCTTASSTEMDDTMLLFSGQANVELASSVAKLLGVPLGDITVGRFADGEVNVQVHDNVRGKDVYLIQPTCTPVNEHLMELLLMVSTMRRASAERITAVIPYYGYARQDRKMTARVPISAADVARLLESMGVDRVVAVDLHCGQIQGFFGPRVPVDNLDAGTVGVKYFVDKGLVNPVVVSPDAGGVYRAKQFREGLNLQAPGLDAGLAMIIKQRPKAGQVERMDLVGNVEGCDVVIVDDMIDTATTLCFAASELKKHGARRVFAFASHGLFSGPASERIARSELEQVVVTNTIPLAPASRSNDRIHQLSVAPLVAEAIRRVHLRQSVSDLFKQQRKAPAPAAAPAAVLAVSAPAVAAAAPASVPAAAAVILQHQSAVSRAAAH